MTRRHTVLASLVLIYGLVTTGRAVGEGGASTILLRNGDAITCTLVADDGKKITIIRLTDDVRQSFDYAELHPRTVYRLMRGRTKNDDAEGQMVIAAYALDNGFFENARRHFRLAVKADDKLGNQIEERLEALRQRAGVVVLAWSKEQLDGGDVLGAERYLGLILDKFPNTPVAEEAAELLGKLAERSVAARQKKVEARAVAESESASDELKKKLEPGIRYYKRAHEFQLKGLQSHKKHNQAIRHFQRAVAEFAKARKVLVRVANEFRGEESLQALVRSYYKTLNDDTIEVKLHLASEYFYRGSLVNARKIVNQALAIDSKHKDAMRLRTRIRQAEIDDEGRFRGRRRR